MPALSVAEGNGVTINPVERRIVHCRFRSEDIVCWLVACLMSQQHVCLSQGRVCSDKLTRGHTEIKVANQIFYLTKSEYTDTGPTSPDADLVTPDAWQGSH